MFLIMIVVIYNCNVQAFYSSIPHWGKCKEGTPNNYTQVPILFVINLLHFERNSCPVCCSKIS
ncbi:hypothetical protein AAHE18_04G141100 [Arachis hypogaea]